MKSQYRYLIHVFKVGLKYSQQNGSVLVSPIWRPCPATALEAMALTGKPMAPLHIRAAAITNSLG